MNISYEHLCYVISYEHFRNLFHNHLLDKGNLGPDRKTLFLFFSQPFIRKLSIFPHGLGIECVRDLKPLKSFTAGNHRKLKISHHRPQEAFQLTVCFGYKSANMSWCN